MIRHSGGGGESGEGSCGGEKETAATTNAGKAKMNAAIAKSI